MEIAVGERVTNYVKPGVKVVKIGKTFQTFNAL